MINFPLFWKYFNNKTIIEHWGKLLVKSRLFTYCAAVLILSFSLSCCSSSVQNISDKLIRFHVIANSDSDEDQNLKLKVRDKVLSEIGPIMENSKSKEESQEILSRNIETIKNIAKSEVSSNGKNYDVAVLLGKSSFPTKTYSDIVLPAGEYDALKVVIGEGEGKNWWCVMFPPLCFIDITHGVTTEDTEMELKTVLSDSEYNEISTNIAIDRNKEAVKKPVEPQEAVKSSEIKKQPENPEVKFKSVEIFRALLAKLEAMFGGY